MLAALAGNAVAAGAPDTTDGDLYFVNLTKQAASLTLDEKPRAAPYDGEVQGRPVPAGRHVLHIAVEGRTPMDLQLDLGLDHVAEDETGRAFWCVVAVIDDYDQLRIVPFQPKDCSKVVAEGLHPADGRGVTAGLHGDLYFINTAGQAAELVIDQNEAVEVPTETVFGNPIGPGEHDLHLAFGAARTVDVHVNFDAAHLGHGKAGRGYWCVGATSRPNGSPTVFEYAAEKCSNLIAAGYEPPTK